jgi:hypothetical protein
VLLLPAAAAAVCGCLLLQHTFIMYHPSFREAFDAASADLRHLLRQPDPETGETGEQFPEFSAAGNDTSLFPHGSVSAGVTAVAFRKCCMLTRVRTRCSGQYDVHMRYAAAVHGSTGSIHIQPSDCGRLCVGQAIQQPSKACDHQSSTSKGYRLCDQHTM